MLEMRTGAQWLLTWFLIVTSCSCDSPADLISPHQPLSDSRPSESSFDVSRLPQVLQQLDVGHHWLAGKHVNWLTGKPDGLPVGRFGHHTHCSAFVAAVCHHLSVPILEPPQHPQELLATAQYEWLISPAGKSAGWAEFADAVQANRDASAGGLLIAVYPSPDIEAPGHIAIVLPSQRELKSIQADGPDITQAGLNNYARTTLRVGFQNHPLAWETARGVRFFVYQPSRNH